MVNFVQNLVIYAVWLGIFKDAECKFRVRDGVFELTDRIIGKISVNFGPQHIPCKKGDVESESQPAPSTGLRMMQPGELAAIPNAELNMEPAAVYRHNFAASISVSELKNTTVTVFCHSTITPLTLLFKPLE